MRTLCRIFVFLAVAVLFCTAAKISFGTAASVRSSTYWAAVKTLALTTIIVWALATQRIKLPDGRHLANHRARFWIVIGAFVLFAILNRFRLYERFDAVVVSAGLSTIFVSVLALATTRQTAGRFTHSEWSLTARRRQVLFMTTIPDDQVAAELACCEPEVQPRRLTVLAFEEETIYTDVGWPLEPSSRSVRLVISETAGLEPGTLVLLHEDAFGPILIGLGRCHRVESPALP